MTHGSTAVPVVLEQVLTHSRINIIAIVLVQVLAHSRINSSASCTGASVDSQPIMSGMADGCDGLTLIFKIAVRSTVQESSVSKLNIKNIEARKKLDWIDHNKLIVITLRTKWNYEYLQKIQSELA
uniref:Uncharacterized protein n=1 Tax=Homalodisca liturata TaxID=320908 RepID=A0A1B6HB35_9HEMI